MLVPRNPSKFTEVRVEDPTWPWNITSQTVQRNITLQELRALHFPNLTICESSRCSRLEAALQHEKWPVHPWLTNSGRGFRRVGARMTLIPSLTIQDRADSQCCLTTAYILRSRSPHGPSFPCTLGLPPPWCLTVKVVQMSFVEFLKVELYSTISTRMF